MLQALRLQHRRQLQPHLQKQQLLPGSHLLLRRSLQQLSQLQLRQPAQQNQPQLQLPCRLGTYPPLHLRRLQLPTCPQPHQPLCLQQVRQQRLQLQLRLLAAIQHLWLP